MLQMMPGELDPVIHAPVRLTVVALLATRGPQDFSTIKQHLVVTDGALGMHLKKLIMAGYAKCQKAFYDGKPRSTYYLSQAGREALGRYVRLMEELSRQVQAADRLVTPNRMVRFPA